ncbi:inositol monophosphatase family protein [Ilumatobacter sp.]|uniref:inositol monophosphatase family protein n=1 Tax=Ilumatobacter sp. TaxID=1967498 RepID=UPI003C622993
MDRPNDPTVEPETVLALFGAICDRTAGLLAGNDDWAMSGRRSTQYAIDVAIDAVCLDLLHDAGFAVLSEESGITNADQRREHDLIVVVDPLDGSTNAALGLPWCATALCLVVDEIPEVSMVSNLRTGDRYSAVRGAGATRNGRPIRVGTTPSLADAIIAVNARPPESFHPAQFRSMGSTALDIASVALPGGFDGSVDFDEGMIGIWDYLAAVLILEEAGGVATDAVGRDLVTLDHDARRRPVTAGSRGLLDELLVACSR